MKILWMSDSPTSASGFGNVTRFVCAGLAACGHQVDILGWQTRGLPVTWERCTLFPFHRGGFNTSLLRDYLSGLRPDVLVTLHDISALTSVFDPLVTGCRRTAGIPWVMYYPIGGDLGDGHLPESVVQVLKAVELPVAMSQYGRDVTQANGVTPAYIPHGVDTSVFQPPADKSAAKRALGYDGRFVVLSDARNQPRKLLPRALEIFRRFAADKDDVVLHLHSDPEDPIARSPTYTYDLRSDISFLGLSDKVRITAGFSIRKGLSLSHLAAIYQAADVHLLASWGEGFGLPTLQAAAAGVVPLASDYSASRELVLGHGEPIRVKHFVRGQSGGLHALIDIDDMVSRLQRLYQDRPWLVSKSQAAARFAQSYDWTRIVVQWHDLLEREVPSLRRRVRSRADNVLTADTLREVACPGHTLTLPVTLPPAAPQGVQARVIGYVYAAGPADVGAVRLLSRIFPGLQVWSTVALEVDSESMPGEPLSVTVVPKDSPTYWSSLAASTLALDLGGANPALPAESADIGVSCIGLTAQSEQRRLWPELSLESSDPTAAATLARWMLTDQGDAAEVCRRARQRLAGRGTCKDETQEPRRPSLAR
jgi:glycosyltransferase involved in cell wall biosynthesis